MNKEEIIKKFTEELEESGFNAETKGARVAKRVLLEIVNEAVKAERSRIKERIIEFAVDGADNPDEIKGLDLYSKIMKELSQQEE